MKLACEKLWRTNSPLAFSIADVAKYPVLQGEAADPHHPSMLVSPCEGALPPEAFDPVVPIPDGKAQR